MTKGIPALSHLLNRIFIVHLYFCYWHFIQHFYPIDESRTKLKSYKGPPRVLPFKAIKGLGGIQGQNSPTSNPICWDLKIQIYPPYVYASRSTRYKSLLVGVDKFLYNFIQSSHLEVTSSPNRPCVPCCSHRLRMLESTCTSCQLHFRDTDV